MEPLTKQEQSLFGIKQEIGTLRGDVERIADSLTILVAIAQEAKKQAWKPNANLGKIAQYLQDIAEKKR